MTSLQRFSARRVLVTGAGSGIGQAIVLRILDEGGMVAAADISADGLANTQEKAGRNAERMTSVVMDVGDESSVKSSVAESIRILGGLDGLVNAAGILRSTHFEQTTLTDFEQIIRINLIGTFLVIRESLSALREGTGPAVVNFSSTAAEFGIPYMSAYAASKAGIQAMTHTLATEFGKEGIRFNSVQPASISGGTSDGSGAAGQNVGPGLPSDADFSLFAAPVLPLDNGRIFAAPDAVASVVAMLVSADSYFVTGTEVRIDGGAHM